MPRGLQAAMVSASMSRLPSSGCGVKRTPGISAYFPMVAMRTVLAFMPAMVSASAFGVVFELHGERGLVGVDQEDAGGLHPVVIGCRGEAGQQRQAG